MRDTRSPRQPCGVFRQGRGLRGGGRCLALLPGVSCSRPQHRPIWSSCCCKATGSPTRPGDAGPSPGLRPARDPLQTLGVMVGCTEGPHLTAYPCETQGWGQGSKAVYKPLKLFMVPGGTLAIQRDTCQIVLAGSEAAPAGSPGLRAPLRLPASPHSPLLPLRPSQEDGFPSGMAQKPPPPGSNAWSPDARPPPPALSLQAPAPVTS